MVHIQGLRGIEDLRVAFGYPVSVLAGPNACGKSTVLLALACAYRPPHSGPRDFVPSTLFPDFVPRSQRALPSDRRGGVRIEFDYLVDGQPRTMRWKRGKSWNRSGYPGGVAPQRDVYLRTLANLTSPSEVRSILQMGRRELRQEDVDVADLQLAHRVLSWKYRRTVRLRSAARELLFAFRDGDVAYSEFHMSSGERSVLRLSLELSRRKNALVLIDEVEAGLHPFTQQLLMLQLQWLAVRNQLQIVVATHSPVVLECVPAEGRIFLEREGGVVTVRPTYQHVVQHALYGSAIDKLSVVCEDEAAEAIIHGVVETLAPALELRLGDIEIGRDSGKSEFKHHVRAFARFQLLSKTVFVLDGDARSMEQELRAVAQEHGQSLNLVYLPGEAAPEAWAWDALSSHVADYAPLLGMDLQQLERVVNEAQRIYDQLPDRRAQRDKALLEYVASQCGRTPAGLLRIIAREEAERERGAMAETRATLRDAIERWARTEDGD